MRKMIVLGAALLALAACQSAQNLDEGQRLNWRCANDKEFSLRFAGGAAEVYAAGETHRLPQTGDGVYSNGTVTYSEAGGATSLTGVHGGPYESCARQRGDWWPDLW
ncbi:MAG TPA: hypothetical protein VM915_04380 [Verrucomicrobiae bacterium]|nr:hypothetical protein [Verrucomicrobiae bacterium]